MRVCVIFNPAARGEKARRFRTALGRIAAESALKPTSAPGDARKLAAEAVLQGFDTLVAAGGDGTVNEVLNGLGDVPGGFEKARLAVLPLGTVNVFARELLMPSNPAKAWETIRHGQDQVIDLPFVEYAHNSSVQKRYFAQLAGAGLDARAIELVAWEMKKRIGALAYVLAGLRALTGKPSLISASADVDNRAGGLILVGNGRLYGGSFRIFPEADLRDGMLEVCVFPTVDWLTLARCGPRLLLTNRLPGSAVQTFRTKTLTLRSETRVPFEVDGELVGNLPATFGVEPSRLHVIIP